MVCPFRVGAKFEYALIGEDTSNPDSYVQVAQTAVYPPCYEGECPYYNYDGSCERMES